MSAVAVLPAEGFLPTLTKLVTVLEQFKIRFHLTGGITAIAYGEPRMTQDVDLVLDPVVFQNWIVPKSCGFS